MLPPADVKTQLQVEPFALITRRNYIHIFNI